MNKTFSNDLFNKMPIVGIMRDVSGGHAEILAKLYSEAGLTCLEVTMNSADAPGSIEKLAGLYGDVLNIGAGTVCSMHDLEAALKANAQFIVTPVINEEVIKTCVDEKIPIFPGAYTPSEIYRAWSLGAGIIKLFPAGDIKPAYIKEVLAPLKQVKLMPTGGMTLDNFTDYLAAGAKAVGIGSGLFPKTLIDREDWRSLREIYSRFAEKYIDFSERDSVYVR